MKQLLALLMLVSSLAHAASEHDVKACLRSMAGQKDFLPKLQHRGKGYLLLPIGKQASGHAFSTLVIRDSLDLTLACENPGCPCKSVSECMCSFKTNLEGTNVHFSVGRHAGGYMMNSSPDLKDKSVKVITYNCKNMSLSDAKVEESIRETIAESLDIFNRRAFSAAVSISLEDPNAAEDKSKMLAGFNAYVKMIAPCGFAVADPVGLYCSTAISRPREIRLFQAPAKDHERIKEDYARLEGVCKREVTPSFEENKSQITTGR